MQVSVSASVSKIDQTRTFDSETLPSLEIKAFLSAEGSAMQSQTANVSFIGSILDGLEQLMNFKEYLVTALCLAAFLCAGMAGCKSNGADSTVEAATDPADINNAPPEGASAPRQPAAPSSASYSRSVDGSYQRPQPSSDNTSYQQPQPSSDNASYQQPQCRRSLEISCPCPLEMSGSKDGSAAAA